MKEGGTDQDDDSSLLQFVMLGFVQQCSTYSCPGSHLPAWAVKARPPGGSSSRSAA
jgi:hypothetical protein